MRNDEFYFCNTLYPVNIIRVIDADTIELYIFIYPNITIKEKIRLYGIDTPESRTSNKIEKEAGLFVKNKLIELLDKSDHIEIDIKGFGKFGRPLGELFISKELQYINVNKWLVENKYCKEYFGDKKEEWTIEELKGMVEYGN